MLICKNMVLISIKDEFLWEKEMLSCLRFQKLFVWVVQRETTIYGIFPSVAIDTFKLSAYV